MIKALCTRTAMIGGGTSYHVYFRKADKPSHPLHNGHIYSTTIIIGGKNYFSPETAIEPKSYWTMEPGMEKWEASKRLEKIAARLAARIAKRAFPELRGARKLPSLWAGWNKPSAEKWVKVNITLPE